MVHRNIAFYGNDINGRALWCVVCSHLAHWISVPVRGMRWQWVTSTCVTAQTASPFPVQLFAALATPVTTGLLILTRRRSRKVTFMVYYIYGVLHLWCNKLLHLVNQIVQNVKFEQINSRIRNKIVLDQFCLETGKTFGRLKDPQEQEPQDCGSVTVTTIKWAEVKHRRCQMFLLWLLSLVSKCLLRCQVNRIIKDTYI